MKQPLCEVVQDIAPADICLKIRDMWDDEVCNVVNLHTLLPLNITTSIQQIFPCFVDSSKDTWIWTASLNGQYNAKSGYTWLLSQHHNEISQGSW